MFVYKRVLLNMKMFNLHMYTLKTNIAGYGKRLMYYENYSERSGNVSMQIFSYACFLNFEITLFSRIKNDKEILW